MKNYKNYEKSFIGASDIASLILVGCGENGLLLHDLHFGSDGCYDAYIVDSEDVEAGEHYKKVATFKDWLKIYDDSSLVKCFEADKIEVYRAAEMGCIIKLIGGNIK